MPTTQLCTNLAISSPLAEGLDYTCHIYQPADNHMQTMPAAGLQILTLKHKAYA